MELRSLCHWRLSFQAPYKRLKLCRHPHITSFRLKVSARKTCWSCLPTLTFGNTYITDSNRRLNKAAVMNNPNSPPSHVTLHSLSSRASQWINYTSYTCKKTRADGVLLLLLLVLIHFPFQCPDVRILLWLEITSIGACSNIMYSYY